MTRIETETWRYHAFVNRMQSFLLLSAMGGLLALLGWLIWGSFGIVLLLAMGATLVLLNPAFAPELIMRLYGALPITPAQAPGLYRALEELASRAGLLAVPRLYYVPSRVLNAFALGSRNDAAIGITAGLLRSLDFREAVAVLAHELSHIENNDLWVMGVADLFSRMTGALSMVGQLLLLVSLPLWLIGEAAIHWLPIALLILAPGLSGLVQLGLSRTREYHADLNAAALTGDPEGLARALLRMERLQGPWLERVFMPGRRVPDPSLLRTHPPTEERVRRLMELQPQREPAPDWLDPSRRVLADGFGRPRPRRPRWHINGLWY